MQFQLSGLTTGNTKIMTNSNASCVFVGNTHTQPLPNKPLTYSSKNIMASFLKSATTTVGVSTATAPTIN